MPISEAQFYICFSIEAEGHKSGKIWSAVMPSDTKKHPLTRSVHDSDASELLRWIMKHEGFQTTKTRPRLYCRDQVICNGLRNAIASDHGKK